jgi:hypothetical protein
MMCRRLFQANGDFVPSSEVSYHKLFAIFWKFSEQYLEQRRLRPSYPSESDAVTSLHCLDIPEKVTLLQLVRGVIAYIEARPQRMHESFNDLALEALRTAWPCR